MELVNRGANINFSKNGKTPLLVALKKNYYPIIKYLANQYVLPAVPPRSPSCLFTLCTPNLLITLSKNLEVDKVDSCSWNFLHFLASQPVWFHISVCNELLTKTPVDQRMKNMLENLDKKKGEGRAEGRGEGRKDKVKEKCYFELSVSDREYLKHARYALPRTANAPNQQTQPPT